MTEPYYQTPREDYTKLAKLVDPDYDRAFDISHRVLCISPHPDDCEIGAGGTLAKMISWGATAYLVVVTDGSRGAYKPGFTEEEVAYARRAEQEEAARTLGLAGVYWIGARDGELCFDRAVLEKLITIIRVARPELVFIPDPYLHYEAHPDHYYTGRLASAAVLFSGLPLFVKVDTERGVQPHTPRFVAYYYTSKPNTIVDVSDYIEKKVEALRKHKSQFTEGNVLDLVLKYMEFVGRRIGVRYAEEFKVLPTSLLHVAPFAEYV